MTHTLFRCFTQLSYKRPENSAFVSLWNTELELPILGIWPIFQQFLPPVKKVFQKLRFCGSCYLLTVLVRCETLWLQVLNRQGVQKYFRKRFQNSCRNVQYFIFFRQLENWAIIPNGIFWRSTSDKSRPWNLVQIPQVPVQGPNTAQFIMEGWVLFSDSK